MLEIGSIIDRYRVDAMLGEGTTGRVYRVTHTHLHVQMVLKHLRDGAEAGIRHSLLEEGRIQSLLRHQNVVAVLDSLDIDGRPALVMEWVKGPDLAEWLDERPQPPLDEALPIFRGIVEGLGVAHQSGFVHRDLKPENLLLDKDSQNPKVTIIDFGTSGVIDPQKKMS